LGGALGPIRALRATAKDRPTRTVRAAGIFQGKLG